MRCQSFLDQTYHQCPYHGDVSGRGCAILWPLMQHIVVCINSLTCIKYDVVPDSSISSFICHLMQCTFGQVRPLLDMPSYLALGQVSVLYFLARLSWPLRSQVILARGGLFTQAGVCCLGLFQRGRHFMGSMLVLPILGLRRDSVPAQWVRGFLVSYGSILLGLSSSLGGLPSHILS